MARVTVEDCVEKIPNRFELIMLSAQRARDLAAGAPMTVAKDNDKNTVVALREIAEGTVAIAGLKENLVKAYQRHTVVEEPQPDPSEDFALSSAMDMLDAPEDAADDDEVIADADESALEVIGEAFADNVEDEPAEK